MSLDDVAKVTKIQPRILERLEAGKLDGLPADVFVRGFVRSFARCVGLDEGEALRRYAACGLGAGSPDLMPAVRALVEVMADLAPGSATAVRATPRKMEAVEIIDLAPVMPVAEAIAACGGAPRSAVVAPTGSAAIATPVEAAAATEVDAAATAVEAAAAALAIESSVDAHPAATVDAHAGATVDAEPAVAMSAEAARSPEPSSSKKKRSRRRKARAAAREARTAGLPRQALALGTPPAASPIVASSAAEAAAADEPIEAAARWAPRMPPLAAPSVPWRRPAYQTTAIPVIAAPPASSVPSLVIDDADPESAERLLEERAEKLAPRRSFLPPILLDREDRSARQGGLTLAVILLLIAATLTLSYLMRRPSAGGDGVTARDARIHRLG